MRTDNPENVGKHAFEAAGLGVAPFRFTGAYTKVYVACPGAPAQPGSSCDYCGASIMNVCEVTDVNGKRFKVGCDCIAKVGDRGLLQAYKNSPEVRRARREATLRRNTVKAEEAKAIFTTHRDALASLPHPHGYVDRETGRALSAADYYAWMFAHCGLASQGKLGKGILRRLGLAE